MIKLTIYSHTPGFRRWGRAWSHEAAIVGVVKTLGKAGRTQKGCDFVITETEYEAVKRLTAHAAFPLRIAEGESPDGQVKAESRRLSEERDTLLRATGALRSEREGLTRELDALGEERTRLERELAELRDAATAAEARAIAAEQVMEASKKG